MQLKNKIIKHIDAIAVPLVDLSFRFKFYLALKKKKKRWLQNLYALKE